MPSYTEYSIIPSLRSQFLHVLNPFTERNFLKEFNYPGILTLTPCRLVRRPLLHQTIYLPVPFLATKILLTYLPTTR